MQIQDYHRLSIITKKIAEQREVLCQESVHEQAVTGIADGLPGGDDSDAQRVAAVPRVPTVISYGDAHRIGLPMSHNRPDGVIRP